MIARKNLACGARFRTLRHSRPATPDPDHNGEPDVEIPPLAMLINFKELCGARYELDEVMPGPLLEGAAATGRRKGAPRAAN